MTKPTLASLLLLSTLISGFSCQPTPKDQAIDWAQQFKLDSTQAQKDLEVLTAFPHPMGTPRQQEITRYINQALTTKQISSHIQPFTAQTPNPLLLEQPQLPSPLTIEKSGANIIGVVNPLKRNCVVAMGSHYDSKHLPNQHSLGANDSGSSTIALIQILQYFNNLPHLSRLKCGLMGVFFDGEEAILPNWNDGIQRHPAKSIDNTYGSRFLVAKTKPCPGGRCLEMPQGNMRIVALVLIDMIGHKNMKLSVDSHSHKGLISLAKGFDLKLHNQPTFVKHTSPIEDDHIPFIKAGIPAIDLIDFNNISEWHTSRDTLEKLSMKSIEKSSRIAISLSLYLAIKGELP